MTRENFQAIWIWLHENVDILVLIDEIKKNEHNIFNQFEIDLLTKESTNTSTKTDMTFYCFEKLISHLCIPIQIDWLLYSNKSVFSQVFNCDDIMYNILDYADVTSVCVLNGTCRRMLWYIACIKSHNKSLTSDMAANNISWPGLYHISKAKYYVCKIAHNKQEANINEEMINRLYFLPWNNLRHICIVGSDDINYTYLNNTIIERINDHLCSQAKSIVIKGDLGEPDHDITESFEIIKNTNMNDCKYLSICGNSWHEWYKFNNIKNLEILQLVGVTINTQTFRNIGNNLLHLELCGIGNYNYEDDTPEVLLSTVGQTVKSLTLGNKSDIEFVVGVEGLADGEALRQLSIFLNEWKSMDYLYVKDLTWDCSSVICITNVMKQMEVTTYFQMDVKINAVWNEPVPLKLWEKMMLKYKKWEYNNYYIMIAVQGSWMLNDTKDYVSELVQLFQKHKINIANRVKVWIDETDECIGDVNDSRSTNMLLECDIPAKDATFIVNNVNNSFYNERKEMMRKWYNAE